MEIRARIKFLAKIAFLSKHYFWSKEVHFEGVVGSTWVILGRNPPFTPAKKEMESYLPYPHLHPKVKNALILFF